MCDDISLAKITTKPRFDNAKCKFYHEPIPQGVKMKRIRTWKQHESNESMSKCGTNEAWWWTLSVWRNRPFPRSLVPLFQKKSKCETFHMKMSSACSFIFMEIEVIFIRMVSHSDSLWKRGTKELGNSLSRIRPILMFEISVRLGAVHFLRDGEGGRAGGFGGGITKKIPTLKEGPS